jgi:DNA-binding CsgD family transcriptional regulator
MQGNRRAMAADGRATAGGGDLGRILDLFDRRRYAGVVVTGPPGSGRTHLARTAMGAAATAGAATEWVTATPAAASIRFGALAHVLPAVLPPSGSDPLAQFVSVSAALVERAAGRPLLLAVDDAHLLEAASLALVMHLAHSGRAFILATARTGDPGTEPVLSLWRDGVAERLDLRPLDEDQTAAVAESRLGGAPLDGPSRRSLFEVTRGNPQLVRQVVEDELECGALRFAGSVWTASRRPQPGRRVAELVEARLAGLPEAERRALECLALGGPLDLAVFEGLVDVELVRSLERRELVVACRRERRMEVRVADPLMAAALRAAVPAGIAASIRRDLAAALEAYGLRRGADLLRVATWRLDEDDAGEPDLLIAAARLAGADGDHELAERLSRAALDAGGGVAATVQLGAALTCRNRFADAAAALAVHEDELRRAPDAEARALVLWRARALLRSPSATAGDDALTFLLGAEALLADAGCRGLVQAARASVLTAVGRHAQAVSAGQSVLAHPGADPEATRIASASVTLALTLSGQPGAALRQPQVPDAGDGGDELIWARLVALTLAGRLDDAEALAASTDETAPAAGDDGRRGRVSVARGLCALMRGRVATARRWLWDAAVPLRRSDVEGDLPLCLTLLSVAEALCGDLDGARCARDEARTVAAPSWRQADLVLADVWIAAAAGHPAEAQRQALDGAALAEGRPLLQAILLHDAMRLGCPAEHVETGLARAAAAVDVEWPGLLARQASAAARRSATELEAVVDGFEDAGMLLLAAEAAQMAAAADHEAGESRRGSRRSARAARLFDQCEGARPLGGRAARTEFASLTSREREVAGLAALGLTSTEIARRLVVSSRTVESHLYNAYAKLGINRREALRPALMH